MRIRRLATSLVVLAACADAFAENAPSPPAAPASGWGSPAARWPRAAWSHFANAKAPDYTVHVVRPVAAAGSPPLPERLPVVAYLHGFGATDPSFYAAWLEHMARQGTIVVYPSYPALESKTRLTRYDVMWSGLAEALDRLDAGPAPRPDRARLGVVGHSFGGGAVAAIAARASARGIGREALWLEAWAPWYDVDRGAWASLPPHALLLAVGFCDDDVCETKIAQNLVARATTIRADRKALLVFQSDHHGRPALRAHHSVPGTRFGTDAFDTRGVWRLDDALRDHALTGSKEARAAVFSSGPETTALGTWSDGVPVAPLTVGLPAADEGDAPQKLRWPSGGVVETFARVATESEAWSRLPVPSPKDVPADRLPSAERFVKAPPASPWPAGVAEALEKGPVLVVLSEAAGESAGTSSPAPVLEKAEERLAARGGTVVRAALGLGRERLRFDAQAEATALLLSKEGKPLLWRDASEPNVLDVVDALLAR
jgi:dienelactone hydrolase